MASRTRKANGYHSVDTTEDEKQSGPGGFGDTENDDVDLKELEERDYEAYKIVTFYPAEGNKIDTRIYLALFLVVFPVYLHLGKFISETTDVPTRMLRVMYLLFAFALTWIIKLLFQWVNEDSISGMVAQRHTKTAYFALLGILSLSAFTSGLFSIFAIRSNIVEKNNWKSASYVLGFLSPLFSACILIAPLPLYKTARELGFRILGKKTTPLYKKVPKKDSNNNEIPNEYEWVLVQAGTQEPTTLQFYSIRLWEQVPWSSDPKNRCGLSLQKILHYVFVLTGVGLGYFATVVQLYFNWHDREYHFYFCIVYLVCSALGMFLFLNQGDDQTRREKLRKMNRDGKSYMLQQSLLKEFLGLFYYLCALITVLVINRNLISQI